MATNGEVVSRVINNLKLLNKDEHISRRYVLFTLKEKAKFLIQQKLEMKTTYRDDSLYSWVRCFKLKKDNVVDCGIVQFTTCKKLMKSVEKLPDVIYSKFGDAVKIVTTIDGSKVFNKIDIRQYALNKSRNTTGYNPSYFYVQDGYLYLPDSDIKMVDVLLLTSDTEDIPDVSECDDCKSCESAWDVDFIGSDSFRELVIQDTINELSRSRGVIPDENPNRDQNIRSQTVK